MKCSFHWVGDFFRIIPFAQCVVQSGGTIAIQQGPTDEPAHHIVLVSNMTAAKLGPIVRKYWDEGCSDEDLEVYLYEED